MGGACRLDAITAAEFAGRSWCTGPRGWRQRHRPAAHGGLAFRHSRRGRWNDRPAYLVGGLFLLVQQRIITGTALAAFCLCSCNARWADKAAAGLRDRLLRCCSMTPVAEHVAAFFIVTDPVSALPRPRASLSRRRHRSSLTFRGIRSFASPGRNRLRGIAAEHSSVPLIDMQTQPAVFRPQAGLSSHERRTHWPPAPHWQSAGTMMIFALVFTAVMGMTQRNPADHRCPVEAEKDEAGERSPACRALRQRLAGRRFRGRRHPQLGLDEDGGRVHRARSAAAPRRW